MPHRRIARVLSVCALSAAALLGSTATAGAAPTDAAGIRFDFASGTYGPPGTGASAVTYDEKLVPEGANARVVTFGHPTIGTTTGIAVAGLLPNRDYGVHAHTKPCGPNGDAAGPHFQNEPDPVTPSVDPKYANPRNEVWMDFTTNRSGVGHGVSNVDWSATDERAPKSVLIHEMRTLTGPGEAGMAGDRLACINVDF